MSMLHAEAGTLRECPSGPVATRQLLYQAATLGIPELVRGLANRGGHGGVETLWATDDNSLTRQAPRAIRGRRATDRAYGHRSKQR